MSKTAKFGEYNYCKGPKFTVTRSITTHDILAIIALLSKSLPTYIIVPEPITEGGIEFVDPNWRNRYKTIRFHSLSQKRKTKLISGRFKWPHIDDDIIHTWKMSPSVLYQHDTIKPLILNTFIKGFHGAVWTQQEIESVIRAFESVGFEVSHKYSSKVPTGYGKLGI
jgi:hypothetical protein